MCNVVKLRWDERPRQEPYLVVTNVARIRGFEYYVHPSPAVAGAVEPPTPDRMPGYASVESALAAASGLAAQHGIDTVYVEAMPGFMGPGCA